MEHTALIPAELVWGCSWQLQRRDAAAASHIAPVTYGICGGQGAGATSHRVARAATRKRRLRMMGRLSTFKMSTHLAHRERLRASPPYRCFQSTPSSLHCLHCWQIGAFQYMAFHRRATLSKSLPSACLLSPIRFPPLSRLRPAHLISSPPSLL